MLARSTPPACPASTIHESAPKHSPYVERPPGLSPIRRHGQIATQLYASRQLPEICQGIITASLHHCITASLHRVRRVRRVRRVHGAVRARDDKSRDVVWRHDHREREREQHRCGAPCDRATPRNGLLKRD
jgi:hypothetical protein